MKACIKWAGSSETDPDAKTITHYDFGEHAGYGLRPGDLIELPDLPTMKIAAKKFQFTDPKLQPRLILWVWKYVG